VKINIALFFYFLKKKKKASKVNRRYKLRENLLATLAATTKGFSSHMVRLNSLLHQELLKFIPNLGILLLLNYNHISHLTV
jgi:hypothetical protein